MSEMLNYRNATQCRRGHDLTIAGALEQNSASSTTQRCTACRRLRDAAYNAEKRRMRAAASAEQVLECKHGHPLTPGNIIEMMRKNGRKLRICRLCHQHRSKPKSHHKKPGASSLLAVRMEQDLTRQITDLQIERDRVSTHWDKAHYTAQIKALEALLHTSARGQGGRGTSAHFHTRTGFGFQDAQ